MNNYDSRQIVLLYEDRENIRRMLEISQQQLAEAEKRVQVFSEQLGVAERVVQVVDGIPLKVGISGLENFEGRWTNVYLNQHNKTTYGVCVNGDSGNSFHLWQGGRCLGFNFTEEEANAIALAWVTNKISVADVERHTWKDKVQ